MSIKGFNISGTTYKVDYPELDNLPQINGNDLVGNLDAESLGLDQVYWAIYRMTTNAEIEAALNDGKIVLCNVPNTLAPLDPPVTCQLTRRNSATNHRFSAITTGTEILLYTAYCINNSWTSGVFELATNASVPAPNPNPAAPLGTASAGSSNTYSRGDHVHAMPSAEDVGAIRDPDTKSNGQVLTYNGYSWVARTPSGGGGGGDISDDLKAALLQIAQKVAYIDSQGQTYYQDLYDALYPSATVVSISAVFNQGSAVIYDTDSLDVLRQYLTVTATYDDSSTAVVTTYTLSGTLTAGTSTITAAYDGKTTSFNVSVTQYAVTPLYNWDLTQSLTDTEQSLVCGTNGTFTEGTGLSFTADNKYADFGAYELDRTYELTIEALNRSNTTAYRRFLMTYKTNNTSVYGQGLIFSTNKGGVQFYTGSWQTAILQTSSIADLDGRWSIYTGTDGKWKVYKNGVYVGQSTTAIAKNSDHTNIYVGSSSGDYTRVKITSFKVYEGEVIN